MNEPIRILILEDHPADAELIVRELRRAGFEPEWTRVDTEPDYLAQLDRGWPIILADYSLPQFSGLRALELLKERGLDIPFILVSGTIGEEAAVAAMRQGAFDYVLKNQMGRLGSAVRHALDAARMLDERRRTGDQLREQAALLDHAKDAIVVRDLGHRICYWNKGAERAYGWTAAEVIGQVVVDLAYKDAAQFEQIQEHVLGTGEWAGELQHMTKDGRLLTVESRWTLVRDDAGKPSRILVINTDVTERRRLELQMLRTQRLDTIGTLVGGIAHDLNNILTPIMMSIDLLKASMTGADDAEVLAAIGSSARRGADIVSHLLTFVRGSSARPSVIRPGVVVGEVEQIMNRTFPKSIDVRTILSPQAWPLKADSTQLHQVLLNLCINARDAMPDGGRITITTVNITLDTQYAATNPDAHPGPYVVIRVEDTGSGIPAHMLERIFDPFFTTKDVGRGTGLGLFSSLNIVRDHGGFIRVDSDPGVGTRFAVYLPAQPEMAGEPADEAMEAPRGRGELVLVVDDEAAMRQITRQILEMSGYRVILAANGVEAVSQYRHRRLDVAAVILDQMMPVMDGTATARALISMNPAVRIIAMSGVTTDANAVGAVGRGAGRFLLKPFTSTALLTALNEVLEGTEAASGRSL